MPGEVALKVFDLNGREVVTLFDGRAEAGANETQWNAAARASGIYVVRMTASGFAESRKIVLLK
jgi:hypothetical protein